MILYKNNFISLLRMSRKSLEIIGGFVVSKRFIQASELVEPLLLIVRSMEFIMALTDITKYVEETLANNDNIPFQFHISDGDKFLVYEQSLGYDSGYVRFWLKIDQNELSLEVTVE